MNKKITFPFLFACAVFPSVYAAETKTLWATDVCKESGWSDSWQNINHCWATSSSQMIDWWQTQLAKKYKLPEKAITGVQELRSWYASRHPEEGRYVNPAVWEYLNYAYDGLNKYSATRPVLRNYMSTNIEAVSKVLYENLSYGSVGVITGTFFGQSHAVTLWGAEFDENNLVTKIYITDSAESGSFDYSSSSKSAAENGLEEYTATIENGNVVFVQEIWTNNDGYLSSSQSKIERLNEIDFLRWQDEYLVDEYGKAIFVPIPEPSAFGLLAGTLALGLVASRRRRKV